MTADTREARRRFLDLAKQLDADGLDTNEVHRGLMQAGAVLIRLGWKENTTI